MIKIKKNPPPLSFTLYLKNQDATFDNMPSQVKSDLRESLLKEQGYICAYCMIKLENDANKTKIEHYISKDEDISKELEYTNLFVVCKGNEGSGNKALTCDTKKGNCKLEVDPKLDAHMATIYYGSDGKIYSSNRIFNHELNKTLNLNYNKGYLISNRKSTLYEFKQKYLNFSKGTRTKSQLKVLYNKYLNDKDSLGYYKPYVGIILHCLKTKGKF
ncbi:retron system putative HNH endonuclease [Cetobacterium sp.]|uniref:retron system putative HNH endonuclease n=1 Tax=Cetobacterium sp. TaxID=2071632 RepID=UPI003EE6329D